MTESKELKYIGNGSVKVAVRSFAPVASYVHADGTDECTICRGSLTGPSLNKNAREVTEISVAKGVCGHVFHYECIAEMSRKKGSCPCPTCGLPWSYDTRANGAQLAHFLTKNKNVIKK